MLVFPIRTDVCLSWGWQCRIDGCDRSRSACSSEELARQSATDHLWSHRGGRPSWAIRVTPADTTVQSKELCPTPIKKRHGTRAEALTHIAGLYRAEKGNPDYRAYKCVCGVYHVGHSRDSLKQRIKLALRG